MSSRVTQQQGESDIAFRERSRSKAGGRFDPGLSTSFTDFNAAFKPRLGALVNPTGQTPSEIMAGRTAMRQQGNAQSSLWSGVKQMQTPPVLGQVSDDGISLSLGEQGEILPMPVFPSQGNVKPSASPYPGSVTYRGGSQLGVFNTMSNKYGSGSAFVPFKQQPPNYAMQTLATPY